METKQMIAEIALYFKKKNKNKTVLPFLFYLTDGIIAVLYFAIQVEFAVFWGIICKDLHVPCVPVYSFFTYNEEDTILSIDMMSVKLCYLEIYRRL